MVKSNAMNNTHNKKRLMNGKKKANVFERLTDVYHWADSVVSIKFLFGLCIGMISLIVNSSLKTKSSTDPVVEWYYMQGVGKDVAGKVNCTNYFHQKTSLVVEIGHGSGGGVAYRPTRISNISWIWEDGREESHESFACQTNIEALEAGRGRPGHPRAPLFNRYNKVFWIASSSGGNVTWRSVLNPVRVTFFPSGFEFRTAQTTIVIAPQPDPPG